MANDKMIINEIGRFLEDHSISYDIVYMGHGPMWDTPEWRSIWQVTLRKHGLKDFTFKFGNSLVNSWLIQYRGEDARLLRPDEWANVAIKAAIRKGNKEVKECDAILIRRHIPPTIKDVLSNLPYHDIGDFEEFCAEFGYDTDSRKAVDAYLELTRQYRWLLRALGPDLDGLRALVEA